MSGSEALLGVATLLKRVKNITKGVDAPASLAADCRRIWSSRRSRRCWSQLDARAPGDPRCGGHAATIATRLPALRRCSRRGEVLRRRAGDGGGRAPPARAAGARGGAARPDPGHRGYFRNRDGVNGPERGEAIARGRSSDPETTWRSKARRRPMTASYGTAAKVKPAKTAASARKQATRRVRLLLRQRQGRRRPHDERHARRQRRRPGRDDQRRPAGAAGLHDLHRRLHASTTSRRARFPPPIESRDRRATSRSSRRPPARRSARPTNPLLVSVRSGAKFSMPGMMDTILNLGLNDAAVEGLKARTSNGRFAFDSYRRFIQMFGNVVLEIPKDAFEHEFEAREAARRARSSTPISTRARCATSSSATRKSCRTKTGPRLPAGSARPARRWRATPCSARG